MTFLVGDAILTIVARAGANMNSVNVATAWHRLAKLHQRGELGKRSFTASNSAARLLQEDVRMEILERLAEKFADEFDAMNLANIAWSCAVMNFNPSGDILSRICDNLIAKAEEGAKRREYPISEGKRFPSPQALNNCLWALVTLKHSQGLRFAKVIAKLSPQLMKHFMPERVRGGGSFVTQTVSNQLWSYATLRFHPGDELMDSFAALVTNHIRSFKPQELSNILWSYATLSHYPGDDFLRLVRTLLSSRIYTFTLLCLTQKQTISKLKRSSLSVSIPFSQVEVDMSNRIGSFSTQDLANNILSVATFQHSDAASRFGLHSFICSLDHQSNLDQVKKFNVQGLAVSIWGVSVIGGFSLKFYRLLWERCSEVRFSESERHYFKMVFQGYLLMTAVAPELAKDMPIPKWLNTDAKELWKEQTSTGATVSSFQNIFSKHLTEMGISHQVEVRTEDKMLSMDIGLDHHRIAYECDGPTHFCVNASAGLVPLSRNNVRDTLLSARGWQVVSVPWTEWASSVDEDEVENFIRRSSDEIGGMS